MSKVKQWIIQFFGLKGHKHIYVKTLSDNGKAILEVCEICGGQDGAKFWKRLNDLYDKEHGTNKDLIK